MDNKGEEFDKNQSITNIYTRASSLVVVYVCELWKAIFCHHHFASGDCVANFGCVIRYTHRCVLLDIRIIK